MRDFETDRLAETVNAMWSAHMGDEMSFMKTLPNLIQVREDKTDSGTWWSCCIALPGYLELRLHREMEPCRVVQISKRSGRPKWDCKY